MTAGEQCTKGYYCPLGSISPTPCPPGYYGTSPGGIDISACTLCDATHYCDTPGSFEVGDKCAEGFICGTGMDRSGPYIATSNSVSSGKCPVGYSCASGATQGDSAYVQCASGSYNDAAGAKECLDCPPGSYCTGGSNRQDCDAGHYCSINSNIANPVNSEMGGECDVYYYCPSGSGQ